MAGYHGRGNTNALKTGANFWLKHRRLPEGPKFRTIGRFLDRVRDGIIEDLGGVGNLSTQEKVLLDNTIVCQGVVMLGAADLKENGALMGSEVRPILKMLATYANTVRLNLETLGLNKRLVDAEIKNYGEWLDAHGQETGEDAES